MFALVSALLSGVAAVYTEWVLKKNNDTLYWQNILLYGFGSVFNFANLAHRCVEAGGGAHQGPPGHRVGCGTGCPSQLPTPARCMCCWGSPNAARCPPPRRACSAAARPARALAGTYCRATRLSPGWWWPTWPSGGAGWTGEGGRGGRQGRELDVRA